jgi:hypothetical protein
MRLNPVGAFWQGGFPCALGPENGWKITGRGTIFCPLPREAFCSDPTPHRAAPAAVSIPANFLKVPLRGTAGRPASLRLPPPRAPPSTPRLFPPPPPPPLAAVQAHSHGRKEAAALRRCLSVRQGRGLPPKSPRRATGGGAGRLAAGLRQPREGARHAWF